MQTALELMQQGARHFTEAVRAGSSQVLSNEKYVLSPRKYVLSRKQELDTCPIIAAGRESRRAATQHTVIQAGRRSSQRTVRARGT